MEHLNESSSTSSPSNDGGGSGGGLPQLLQLRAIYELTTAITSQCFDTCLGRLNPRMEESEKNCLSNCAANFMHMKLLFTSRLIETVRSFNGPNGVNGTDNNELKQE